MPPPPTRPNPAPWHSPHPALEPLSFRRAPVLWAAFFFSLGIAASRLTWQPTVVWLLAALTLAALTLIQVPTQTIRLAPLAALWIAVGLACTEVRPETPTQAALHPFADGLARTVRGRITRIRTLPPQLPDPAADHDGYEKPDPAPTLSVDLDLDAIESITPDRATMTPITGGIRATIATDSTSQEALHCGDTIEAPMRLRTPERYRDPGAWQYADYLLDQGIAAHASIHASNLHILPAAGHRRNLRCTLYAAQAWAANRLIAFTRSHPNRTLPHLLRLSTQDAGMLNAMLFGDRAGLNHQLRLGFERTGSFHLFVVSGMHVGIIAFGLFVLARRLRLPLWAATGITILLTAAYAALTGFGIPVQRAFWMATVFLLAQLFHRSRNTLNALGAAVLAVLVWSPGSLFEASFQMTFLAIVGVAGISIPLAERTIVPYARATRNLDDIWRDVRLPPRLAQFRVLLRIAGEPFALISVRVLGRFANRRTARTFIRAASHLPATLTRFLLLAAELSLISVITEMVMVLPMAVYFHRAAVFALPANLFSLPAIGFLMPAAILTFVASLLSPWAALLPAAVTALMLHAITGIIGRISSAHLADFRTPAPALPICLLAAIAIALCCWAVRKPRLAWTATLLLPLTVVLVLFPEPPIAIPNTLEVTAIDVGQGDSILVTGPTGKSMLVDAGGPIGGPANRLNQGTTGFDIGEEVVAPYLWSRRIRRLDIVALTHEHSDHMGGMPAILHAFRPRELWLGIDVPSPAYQAMLAEAASLGIAIRHLHAGDAPSWPGVQVAVLAPEPTYRNPTAPRNDDSLILRLQLGSASVLLEGDAERSEEAAMLSAARLSPITLLKVGHHGSSTSSGDPFLDALAPRYAVISSGSGNPFGHPRPDVVARFAARGTKLYRTDMFGLTTFFLHPDGSIDTGNSIAGPARSSK